MQKFQNTSIHILRPSCLNLDGITRFDPLVDYITSGTNVATSHYITLLDRDYTQLHSTVELLPSWTIP